MCHERLLAKLKSYGVTDKVNNWIRGFLKDRRQRVKVNGTLSDWVEVTSGVTQGSVLGPVLFVVFINDLPEVVKSLCSMYADDTKIYRSVDTVHDCVRLQNDLDNLTAWAEKWQMKFNADKRQVFQLRHKNEKHVYEMKTSEGEGRVKLSSLSMERDLGVHIDSELKFSKHVEIQTNKANKILGLVRRSYEYLDRESMRLLFTALVRPHLEFANS